MYYIVQSLATDRVKVFVDRLAAEFFIGEETTRFTIRPINTDNDVNAALLADAYRRLERLYESEKELLTERNDKLRRMGEELRKIPTRDLIDLPDNVARALFEIQELLNT